MREEHGRGGSRFLHDRVQVGDRLDADGPHADFRIAAGSGRAILIAGGIGITPILPMARTLAALGSRFELHYAARSPDWMAYRQAVKELAGDRANLYFTRGHRVFRPDLDAILANPDEASHVYVCGPLGLVESVRLTAVDLGWRDEQIHFESFGARRKPEDQPLVVELDLLGLTLEVPPEKTILDALLEADVWAPHECKRGECGMCVTTVLEGEPDHRDFCLSPRERERAMCTCVSRARGGRLVLGL